MTTVSEVILKFGNGQVFAEILGVSPQAITNMKARGAVPSRHWPKLVDEAKARNLEGVTFEALAAIQPEPGSEAA